MYLFYFFGVLAVATGGRVRSFVSRVPALLSDAHAVHALAVAAHVLLSVNCHLRHHVLLKLLVARARPTSAVRCLHAVRGGRFLGARAAGSLGLTACCQVFASIALDTLDASNLNLIR